MPRVSLIIYKNRKCITNVTMITRPCSYTLVKFAANVRNTGNHGCFVINTAHSKIPKFWLEDKMEEFPRGNWIGLEGKPDKEDVDMICIGYTYNKNKFLIFLIDKSTRIDKSRVSVRSTLPRQVQSYLCLSCNISCYNIPIISILKLC